MRPFTIADLPLASWAHPLCGWDAGVETELAQATWEWPKRKFWYSSTMVEPGQVFLIPKQKPHMERQFYGG